MIKLIYFWLNLNQPTQILYQVMPHFITPTIEWPSMVFYLFIYLLLQCWIHALHITFHENMACSLTQSYECPPLYLQIIIRFSWSLSLTLSPQFPHELLNYLCKTLALHHSLDCQISKCRSPISACFICVINWTEVLSFYRYDWSQRVKCTEHIKLHIVKVMKHQTENSDVRLV